MATADGKKTGGRKPGSRNKRTQQVEELLEAMKCNPIEGMAKIALGDADCHVCHEGRVSTAQFYRLAGVRVPAGWSDLETEELADVSSQDMACPICGGTGKAPVDTKLRGDMYKELGQYVAPKRKAIEHSGSIGMSHEDALNELK